MKFPRKSILKKRSILIRTTFLSWLVIILTLEIFIFSFIPYQRKTLRGDLELQAKAIASCLDFFVFELIEKELVIPSPPFHAGNPLS